MSEKLGNINIILTNSFYQNSEKEKADLINENNYYSMMNKKRKRKNSHKSHKLNISKCPSCASSFLRKYYYHIHNDKNVNNKNKSIENRNNKIIEINENQNKSSNNEHKLMKNDNNNNNNLFMDLNSDKYNYETQSKNHNYANNYNKIEIHDYKNIPMNINCINQDKNIILNKNQNINNFSFNNVNDEVNEYSQSHNDNQIKNQKIWITKIKEENEKIKNENLPKKSGQIYLKVKKCVAPEI
jgi:hypothetical protein